MNPACPRTIDPSGRILVRGPVSLVPFEATMTSATPSRNGRTALNLVPYGIRQVPDLSISPYTP